MNPPPCPDIQVVGCQRGLEPHKQPARGEWEACFTFILSPVPDHQWAELFHEVSRGDFGEGIPSRLAWSGRLSGEFFTIFCHPDQLQLYADTLKKIVARTNQFRRDLLEAGDKLAERKRDFEALVQSALDSLQL
jgi:hypothetical protein